MQRAEDGEKQMRELEQIKSLLQKEEELTVYQEMEHCCESLEHQMDSRTYVSIEVERALMQLLSREIMYDSYFLYLLWFAVKCFKKADYLELFCELIASSEYMNPMNQKFALYQVKAFLFRYPELESAKVKMLIAQLEQSIREYFLQVFSIKRRPLEQRNVGTVVVMTHGFLGENHPVSRSSLERCVALQKEMGMKVLLVSTGEDCTTENAIPLYHYEVRNHNEKFDGKQGYGFLGQEIELYQPIKPADTLEGIRDLLEYIMDVNPEFVVYVGEQSFIADLVNDFCPVLAVSTIFSVLQKTHTEFVMVGRTTTEEEKKQSYGKILETLLF